MEFINLLFQKYHNATSCQVLGNLCAMTLHDRNNPACDVLYDLIFRNRLEEAPHLFYESDKVKIPINKEDITTIYKLRKTDTDTSEEPRSHRYIESIFCQV